MTTSLAGRIAIRVHGTPVPQGSKSASVVKGRAILRDSNAKTLGAWRDHVRSHAEDQTTYLPTITDPVKVWVRFTFDRPKSHYLADGIRLRTGAPGYPGHGCGDIDKLQRAIFDALTDAKVWADDTLVVDVRARKFYAGEDELALPRAGVDIVLEPLTAPTIPVPVPASHDPGLLLTGAGTDQEGAR